jgi:hypothetical protein
VTIPRNPYGNLPEGLQDLFWQVPGADHIPDNEVSYAETLWAIGFGYHAEDYDAMGIDPDAVTAARWDYFDYMGLPWDRFDWAAWREEMGYQEA